MADLAPSGDTADRPWPSARELALWGFGLFAQKRYEGEMMLYVADKNGALIRQEEFTAPYAGVAHDFAVTRDHVVIPVMPLTVDLDRLRAGGDF